MHLVRPPARLEKKIAGRPLLPVSFQIRRLPLQYQKETTFNYSHLKTKYYEEVSFGSSSHVRNEHDGNGRQRQARTGEPIARPGTGDKVEFDKAGEWTEVRCRQTGVPAQIVPAQIAEYVKTNYPDAVILQIERDSREWEVKLSNRWEITFDKQMRVIDIDD